MRRLFVVHWFFFLTLRWLSSLLGLAEKSILWDTSTTGDGTTTYTQAEATAFWGYWFTPNTTIGNPHASQGVLLGVGGELAVTGASSPVSVATGAAIVEGFPYRSTAAENVAIPTPAASTRIDRIVLRVSHSTTRTVRITRIAGTEGAGAPALTQVAGTTWDIPLAQVSITTGGVITVTDNRTFCYFATKVSTSMLDDAAVTSAKLRNSGALSVIGRSANSSGVPADISATPASGGVLRESGSVIGFGTVATAGIADDAITNAKLRNSGALSVIGRSANSTGDPADISASAASGAVLRESGSVLGFGTVATAGIADSAVTAAKIATAVAGNGLSGGGGAALAVNVDNSTVEINADTLRVKASGITSNEIATDAVGSAEIVAGAVGTSELANDSVDDTKAGNRVPQFFRRQGGSATNWATAGTSTQTPGAVRMQAGVFSQGIVVATGSGSDAITFPVAFSQPPIVIATVSQSGALGVIRITVAVGDITASGFNYILVNESGFDANNVVLNWLAIGAE